MAGYYSDPTLLTALAEHRLDADLTYVELSRKLRMGEKRLRELLDNPQTAKMFARTAHRLRTYLQKQGGTK